MAQLEARLRQVSAMAEEQARFLTVLGDVLHEAKIPTPKFRSSALGLPAYDPNATAIPAALPEALAAARVSAHSAGLGAKAAAISSVRASTRGSTRPSPAVPEGINLDSPPRGPYD